MRPEVAPTDGRRLRRLEISEELLVNALSVGLQPCEIVRGLPADSCVVDVRISPKERIIGLVLESSEFEPVREEGFIEPIYIEVRKIEFREIRAEETVAYQVSALRPQPEDLVVISPDAHASAEEVQRIAGRLPGLLNGAKAILIHNASIDVITEEEMNRLGWYRKDDSDRGNAA